MTLCSEAERPKFVQESERGPSSKMEVGLGVGEGHERNTCTFCRTTGEKQMTMQVR